MTASPAPAASLADVQALFWRIITHPTGVADFVEQCDETTRAQIERCFDESPTFSRLERLEVYAQGYFYRLLDTLEELFPLTRWRADEVPFHNLVTDFLLAHPSQNPDMTHLGDPFPEFIRNHELDRALPDLAELASVEHAIRAALDAPDGTPTSQAELAALPPSAWPALRFEATPHCRLLELHIDYEALRNARDAGRSSSDVPNTSTGELRRYVVWRHGFKVWTRRLAPEEGDLLGRVLTGQNFEAVASAAQEADLGAQALVGHLLRWTRDGLLTRLAM